MNKGEAMMIRLRFLIIAISILLFLMGGICWAESEIPLVFKYELPVVSEKKYDSHTVTFTHAAHAAKYKITCIQCHHTLEEGATAVEETCMDCHEDTDLRSVMQGRTIPDDERVEYYILSLHDQCIQCHKEIKQYNKNANAPVACFQCHIRK
jgi:hypothetical protein